MGLPPGIGILFRVLTYPIVSRVTDNISYKTTAAIKEIVCNAQGRIVEFRFFCNSITLRIKRILDEISSIKCKLKIIGDNPSKKNLLLKEELEKDYASKIKELENIISDFDYQAISRIGSFFNELIELSQKMYFNDREYFLPRITAKMIIKVEDGNVILEDTFRGLGEHEKHYWRKTYPAQDNSAFDFLINNSVLKVYRCNNIPKDAKEGKYLNPRIDIKKVKKYSQTWKYKWKPLRAIFGLKDDENWIKVWDDSLSSPPASSCYKSTLVVPIGFNGNTNLSQEVKEYLGVDQPSLPQGFLCFDHVYTNYFNKADEKLAYIMADLFSVLWEIYLDTSYFYDEVIESFDIQEN